MMGRKLWLMATKEHLYKLFIIIIILSIFLGNWTTGYVGSRFRWGKYKRATTCFVFFFFQTW